MDKIEHFRNKFFTAIQHLTGADPSQEHAHDFFMSIFEFYSNGGINIFEMLTEAEKEEQLPTFETGIRFGFFKMIEQREDAIHFIKKNIRQVASAVVYFRVEILTSILEIPMCSTRYEYWKTFLFDERLNIETRFRRNVMQGPVIQLMPPEDKPRNHSHHPWWNPLEPDRSVYEELADEYALGD